VKKLIIYGAYDRYNYGDNLMPVLFELFLEKYYSDVLLTHELIFASISESDLSRFGVKRTQPINDCVKEEGVSAVIVIGGEVLCARSSVLFMHMSHFMGVNYIMRPQHNSEILTETCYNRLCKKLLILSPNYFY
jgi:hypothetical protein